MLILRLHFYFMLLTVFLLMSLFSVTIRHAIFPTDSSGMVLAKHALASDAEHERVDPLNGSWASVVAAPATKMMYISVSVCTFGCAISEVSSVAVQDRLACMLGTPPTQFVVVERADAADKTPLPLTARLVLGESELSIFPASVIAQACALIVVSNAGGDVTLLALTGPELPPTMATCVVTVFVSQI